MEDEIKNPEEEQPETVEDDQVADDADETEDAADDSDVESDDDETEDAETDDDGYDTFESEEEYLSQFDLPGKPKTLKDALLAHKEAVRKLNELQQQATRPKQDEVSKPDQEKKAAEFFPRNVITKQFEQMIEDGHVQGENVATYKYLGKVLDTAINPQFEMVEKVLSTAVGEIGRMRQQMRDSAWRRFEGKYKGRVDRERLDTIMNSMGWYDYTKAFRQLAVDDPSLLKEIEKRAEKRGINKATKNRPPRFTGPRRDKESAPIGPDVKKYILPDGSIDKQSLLKLDDKLRNDIMDRIIAGKF